MFVIGLYYSFSDYILLLISGSHSSLCETHASFRFDVRILVGKLKPTQLSKTYIDVNILGWGRFEHYARFLYKKAEQGLAVSHAAKVADMADEYPSHSPHISKAGMEFT
jgi:hypothetical protein